ACYKYIREIVLKAVEYNNFIRVDMEDSPCTDMEIELFRKLKAEFPKNVGLVFQAYMKRSHKDLEDLMDIHSEETPLNYRLCKGIYVEPKEIAYKKYEEINEHFLKDIEYCLKNGVYPGIATHDKPIIEGSYKLIEELKVPKEKYEFQMLYGVTPKLRQSILDKGHPMRVYVPYGKQWFGYSTRRLKENPKMANHIIKAIFFKG
ncbi:MAG: proline dehydrogenase family protein, partial [Bacteroidales bacterium]|nr:proline dehydrogenase family protein [Bacteroidales bacterium]